MESAICIPEPVKFEDCGPTMAAAWTSQSEHFDEGPLCAVVHCMINFPIPRICTFGQICGFLPCEDNMMH